MPWWWLVAASSGGAVASLVLRNFVTPGKKIAYEIRPEFGVDDGRFARIAGSLLGLPLIGGNAIRALQNGDEIFPAMLAAIRSARRTVCLETYIYWSGRIGREFSEALAERGRAGVRVHIVLDGQGAGRLEQPLIDLMRDAGVQIEKFHPLTWRTLSRLNNRTHRKLLIVDGAVGFTGGVGIADQWAGHAELHAKLMIVDELWVSVGSTNFDSRSFRLNCEANLDVLDRAFAAEQAAVFERDLARARRVTLAEWRSRPIREKLVEAAAGLLRSQV
jgi:phosphatidylserine/phosphatidylglycerophosphate/cardiolipin synthase-like enzyme